MIERRRETVKEREREREKNKQGEYENREGKEKSLKKTDVPKLYAYNECKHSVNSPRKVTLLDRVPLCINK